MSPLGIGTLRVVSLFAILLLIPACRQRSSGAAVDRGQRETPAGAGREAAGIQPVQAQMRQMDYHVIPSAVLNIERLRGELHSKKPGKPPVFEEKDSFVLKIHSAEIAMTARASPAS